MTEEFALLPPGALTPAVFVVVAQFRDNYLFRQLPCATSGRSSSADDSIPQALVPLSTLVDNSST
jgi:hypothetical protein